jgi:hypothetical protein
MDTEFEMPKYLKIVITYLNPKCAEITERIMPRYLELLNGSRRNKAVRLALTLVDGNGNVDSLVIVTGWEIEFPTLPWIYATVTMYPCKDEIGIGVVKPNTVGTVYVNNFKNLDLGELDNGERIKE